MTQLKITIDAEFADGEPVIILHTSPGRFKSVLDFLAKGIDLKLFDSADLDRQPDRKRSEHEGCCLYHCSARKPKREV